MAMFDSKKQSILDRSRNHKPGILPVQHSCSELIFKYRKKMKTKSCDTTCMFSIILKIQRCMATSGPIGRSFGKSLTMIQMFVQV